MWPILSSDFLTSFLASHCFVLSSASASTSSISLVFLLPSLPSPRSIKSDRQLLTAPHSPLWLFLAPRAPTHPPSRALSTTHKAPRHHHRHKKIDVVLQSHRHFLFVRKTGSFHSSCSENRRIFSRRLRSGLHQRVVGDLHLI